MNILCKEEVNTGRQIEFDVVKAVCIVGMVLVHVYESFLSEEVMTTGFQNALVNVIQMLVGAPCFMMCMGLGISYTSKNSSKELIKRGITIFIFGYVLNIARGGLPATIIYLTGGMEFSEFIREFINEVLNNDIMQFAGLAMMLMGLLKKWKFNDKQILLTGIVMSIIGSFVQRFDVSMLLNYPIGLFFGTVEYDYSLYISFFPLFNWFIFVAAGYIFGQIMKRCNDKKKFYLFVSPICGILVGIYLIFAIPNNIGMINPELIYYYHLKITDALISVMSVLAYFGIYYAISLILPKFILNFTTKASKNINKIYCIHWIILGWAIDCCKYYLGIENVNQNICTIFAILLFVVSYILADIYSKRKMKNAN